MEKSLIACIVELPMQLMVVYKLSTTFEINSFKRIKKGTTYYVVPFLEYVKAILFSFSVSSRNFVPVNYIKESINIIRTTVLVV